MNKTKQVDYQKFLIENKFDPNKIDWSYITKECVDDLDAKAKDIEDFIETNNDFNNYSENKQQELFDELLDVKFTALKEGIKTAKYKITCTGQEYLQLKEFITTGNTYNTTTVFYGIHIEAEFLDRYRNLKIVPTEEYEFILEGGTPVLIHELLNSMTVTGLKEKAYILATTLRKLTECTKIYNHYDTVTANSYKKITEWNMGLSKDKTNLFKQEVNKLMATEVIDELKKS